MDPIFLSIGAEGINFELLQPNRPPESITLDNLTVPENIPNTKVGRVTVTDPDSGDTHTLSLVDGDDADDNASFQFVGSTLPGRSRLRHKSATRSVYATDHDGLYLENTFTVDLSMVRRSWYHNHQG